MNPQPDNPDPWDRDEQALGRLFRQIMVRGGYGNVDESSKQPLWSTWVLGIFAALIVISLGAVMNAVYSTNGDLREWRGQTRAQEEALSAEIVSLRTEITVLSQEVGAINGSRHSP